MNIFDASIISALFLIFTGAAVLATLALYARQALLVSYILLGILFGPSVFGLVTDAELIKEVAHIGIIFLLFLLGINLPPQKLLKLVRKTTWITGISSLLFAGVGAAAGLALGFSFQECLIVGVTLMFSSTILGLKLLPTTVLHHQRTGELIISILLLQDLIAIVVLLVLQAQAQVGLPWIKISLLFLSLPGLVAFAYLFERHVLNKVLRRFDKIHEYMFLVAIGWCLGIAELASLLGLSYEVGAFIAGVSLATSPVSLFIAESLKPLRDFFLVMFFFALGAGFNLHILMDVLLPATVLAAVVLAIKPVIFRMLFQRSGEDAARSGEIGVRLGQISEFSLLIAVLAFDLNVIGSKAAHLIEVAALLSFIASSYLVVMRYPTPIAVSDRLRRD